MIPNFTMPQIQFSKVSKFICISTLVISFFSMMPNFRKYFALIPASLFLTIPKIWVLIFSIFYEPSILSIIFSCLFIIMIFNFIEPILGSREILRIYLICGFFTNIFVVLFALIMYLITRQPLIMFRTYITSGSSFMGIIVSFIYSTLNLPSMTVCGCIKLRYFAFYKLLIESFISLFTMQCDSLLSSLSGFAISFYYFRYIRRKRNQNGEIPHGAKRGDPQFSFESLIPFLDPNRNDGNLNETNQNSNDTDNRSNAFTGIPHTVGNNP